MTQRPDPAVLAEISSHCACFNVRRAARAITQHYDHVLGPSGLRATQFSLLVALGRTGAIPFSKLANVLGMDRTTITRNLTPLQRGGLLTVRPGPDRRVKLVIITEKGREVLARAIPLWQEAQQSITAGLGAGRWDGLRRELQAIAALAGEADP
jgi:DNA-binding MarR family transcriptional regulator